MEGEWNAVKIARENGQVTVTLNGELIYQRVVDFAGDHTFGFYRDRTRSAARIRNVVMSGDWPESLPEDCLANPAVTGSLAAN